LYSVSSKKRKKKRRRGVRYEFGREKDVAFLRTTRLVAAFRKKRKRQKIGEKKKGKRGRRSPLF